MTIVEEWRRTNKNHTRLYESKRTEVHEHETEKYFDTESDVGYKITNKSGDNNHLK